MAKSYYITSRDAWQQGDSLAALQTKVREAIEACVDFVQVREKDLAAASLLKLVAACAALRAGSSTRLLVNGRADIAVAADADGWHLAQAQLPLAQLRTRLPRPGAGAQLQIVGVSCHNEQEAAEAVQAGADYLLLGPVYATPSKPDAVPLGLERLAKICQVIPIPVFALGGVSRARVRECVQAGARGVAGIRLFQQESDLRQLIAEISWL